MGRADAGAAAAERRPARRGPIHPGGTRSGHARGEAASPRKSLVPWVAAGHPTVPVERVISALNCPGRLMLCEGGLGEQLHGGASLRHRHVGIAVVGVVAMAASGVLAAPAAASSNAGTFTALQ